MVVPKLATGKPIRSHIRLDATQIYWTVPGKRVFTVLLEGQVFENIDLVLVGGAATAFTIQVAKVVDDGFVNVQMFNQINNAKLSGIEIILKEVHTAHAVSQGPVSALFTDIVFVESCWGRVVSLTLFNAFHV